MRAPSPGGNTLDPRAIFNEVVRVFFQHISILKVTSGSRVDQLGGINKKVLLHTRRGCPQDFFQGWTMRGSEGRKSPSRVHGQLPGEVWGKPQKLTTFSQNDA